MNLKLKKFDLSVAITEGKFAELYHPMKGYFREMCKSTSINPISPTFKFTLGIIQVIIKSLSTIISA